MINEDQIKLAIIKGAKIYASISGGKDGDAMVESLIANKYSIEGLIHADLGRIEWPESMEQCKRTSSQFDIPLHIVRRNDGADMLQHWQNRMHKLACPACDINTRKEILVYNKPFWSSASNRYCTSDLKRGPINAFYTGTGHDLIINCEGIRAGESKDRAKKVPLSIRESKSSSFYDGMTPEEALIKFTPGRKLVLTWYPIFYYTTEDVWNTKGVSHDALLAARDEYQQTGIAPSWWPFHPAYTYGNDRVSCMFCVLGSMNDLKVAAKRNPELLAEMISMEESGGATFKNKWSLKELCQ